MNLANGELNLLQQVELSLHSEDYGVEIAVVPEGKYVYASSRGAGILLVYQLTAEDTLQKIQEFYLAGSWPRHFAIQDNLILVADQKGDTAQLLEIDAESGEVSHLTEIQTAPRPAFVCFL